MPNMHPMLVLPILSWYFYLKLTQYQNVRFTPIYTVYSKCPVYILWTLKPESTFHFQIAKDTGTPYLSFTSWHHDWYTLYSFTCQNNISITGNMKKMWLCDNCPIFHHCIQLIVQNCTDWVDCHTMYSLSNCPTLLKIYFDAHYHYNWVHLMSNLIKSSSSIVRFYFERQDFKVWQR